MPQLSLSPAQLVDFADLSARLVPIVLNATKHRLTACFDRHDAKQEILIGIAEGLGTFDPAKHTNKVGWCRRIAHRRVIDGLRAWAGREGSKSRRIRSQATSAGLEHVPQEDAAEVPAEAADGILSGLEAQARVVAELHYLRGLSAEQVAAVVGCTVYRVNAILADITSGAVRRRCLYRYQGTYMTLDGYCEATGQGKPSVLRAAARGSIRTKLVTEDEYGGTLVDSGSGLDTDGGVARLGAVAA